MARIVGMAHSYAILPAVAGRHSAATPAGQAANGVLAFLWSIPDQRMG